MISILLVLLGVGAIVSGLEPGNGTMNRSGKTYHLRGGLYKPNDALVAAKATSMFNSLTTPRFMSIIEYQGYVDISLVTIPLHVFLSDRRRLLDDVPRFEEAVVTLISEIFGNIDNYEGVRFTSAAVIEQRLTILGNDTTTTGLDVHFEVNASVSNVTKIDQNKLKRGAQKLLNANVDVLKNYLETSLRVSNTDTTKSIAMKLKSLRPQIGFGAAAIGTCGIICSFAFLVWQMRNSRAIMKKEQLNSKPTELNTKPTLQSCCDSESFADNDSYLDHSLTFPMPLGREKMAEEWDDVSGPGEYTDDDGSFHASFVFCPSVDQRDIRAAIEDNTDSDSEDDDGASVKGDVRSPPLSPEALREFDIAIRRAEF
jgi:hypothetical protein